MGLRSVLIGKREEILRRFVEDVQSAELTGLSATRPQLLNDLPEFLDRIGLALAHSPPALVLPVIAEGPAVAARSHGEQRQGLGYDVVGLVREYGILRDVILSFVIEDEGAVDAVEYRVLSRHISLGVAEAVKRFTELRDLELARRSAEQFAFIAHELRNPLAIIRLLVDFVRRSPERVTETISDIDEAVLEMQRLLDNTLMVERLRSVHANLPDARVAVPVQAMLAGIVREYAPIARARHLDVVVVADEPITVLADPKLVRSALRNLLHNAIKFTRESTRVTVAARWSGHEVLLSVEDQCGGLPPGSEVRLFEPFVQMGPDRSGFGLGLQIARQAAEAHDGTVTVEDLPGLGCRFTLRLPLPG
jgi:signal transduction histidine kinase